MSQTTTSQIPAAISEFYDKVLLVRALPELLHDLFGQMRGVDIRNSDTAKFRRYNSLTAATAPLTEGVTPTPVQLSKTDITAQIQQYGNVVQVTDMVEWTNQDPVLTETAALLGENAGNSLDRIRREVLVAGTSVRRANAVSARSSIVTKLAAADLDNVIRALENNNAKHFTKMVQPTNKYASSPIRPAYWAIIHPYTHFDLQNSVTDFVPATEYSAQSQTYMQEVGAYKNIRFLMSTNAKIFEDSTCPAYTGSWYSAASTYDSVFATLVFAPDAYGIVPLKGHALEMISKPRGHGTDLLDQYSSHGWKAATTTKILDDSFMYRIEHMASA